MGIIIQILFLLLLSAILLAIKPAWGLWLLAKSLRPLVWVADGAAWLAKKARELRTEKKSEKPESK